MEECGKSQNKKVHPKQRANFFAKLFFCWQIPLFFKYFTNNTKQDKFETLPNLKAKNLGDKLEQLWDEELKKPEPSIIRCVFKLFYLKALFFNLIYYSVEIGTMVYISNSMEMFLLSFENATSNRVKCANGFAVITLTAFRFYVLDHVILNTFTIGLQIKIACTSLLYRKALQMDKRTAGRVDKAAILNLISHNMNCFIMLPYLFNCFWYIFVNFFLGVCFLYFRMDLPCAVGGFSNGVYVIANILILFKQTKSIDLFNQTSDKRIKLTDELINIMQLVKMYTWEGLYMKKITEMRNKELHHLKKLTANRIFCYGSKMFSNRISVTATLVMYIFSDYQLDIIKLCASFVVFEIMRFVLIHLSVWAFTVISDSKVTFRRIQDILLTITYNPSKQNVCKKSNLDCLAIILIPFNSAVGISMTNTHVKLGTKKVLTNITLKLNPRKLSAFVGPSGSGKTTLLNVFLHEIRLETGSLEVNGSVSYAPQEPWVFSASIRQNILFGSAMDRQRYKEVIRVCGLERDLSLWPRGDSTMAGERGVLMSGGQKARINLARAVYRQADIYLLDDPLSAVDAHVAQHIFRECIAGFLKNKCTVLVTHQVQFLKHVQDIYLLKNGQIQAVGDFEALVAAEEKFRNLVSVQDKYNEEVSQTSLDDKASEISKSEEICAFSLKENYANYIKNGGTLLLITSTFASFLLMQLVGSGFDYYFSFGLQNAMVYSPVYLYVIVGLSLLMIVSTFVRSYLNTKFCMNASENLHSKLFNNIIWCPMQFFNTHSSGSILSKFSKDIGTIDNISIVLKDSLQGSLNIIASTAIISFILNWMMIPTFIYHLIIYVFTHVLFKVSKNFGQTESRAKGSLCLYFSTTMRGLATIRSFGKNSLLIKEFEQVLDEYSALLHLQIALKTAFTFWGNFVTFIYNALVICAIIFVYPDSGIAFIGLILLILVYLASLVSFTSTNMGLLANAIISTGHIVAYSQIEPEKSAPESTHLQNWPQYGGLKFCNVSMRYAPKARNVIKNLNLEIKPMEKIGVVGRTGAGKSSLISIIFNLCNFEGNLLIDGVDTKSINLKTLRSKIAIIPQDPVLFSGTIRENLDPFEELDDATLWQALNDVQLKETVAELGLESTVTTEGDNFSVGQRQLLCLVRAILRDCKILILDEATANIDLLTDGLIQRTIRRKFKNSTVITIAHRLSTIMNSDKILVMSDGKAVEFDTPRNLLDNSNGFFFKLVHQGGQQLAGKLMDLIL